MDRVQQQLGRKPATEHEMLADALEVLDRAELCFYVEGVGDDAVALMSEALSSTYQDFDLLRSAQESGNAAPWQAYLRAEERANLAAALADFRRTHGYHRPVRNEKFFFSSRRRHTRFDCDWSSDVCSSD